MSFRVVLFIVLAAGGVFGWMIGGAPALFFSFQRSDIERGVSRGEPDFPDFSSDGSFE
jgi:hypothetical protein